MTSNERTSEYDREPTVHSVRYRPDDGPLGTVIVKAVATVTGTPPTELDPLYDTIDPQALQRMYDTIDEFPDYDGDRSLTFAFGGCTVTVSWTGTVTVWSDEAASS